MPILDTFPRSIGNETPKLKTQKHPVTKKIKR